MSAELIEWLTEDARIDLAADPVGLYEFMWSLHGKDPSLGAMERRAIARAALGNLLEEGGYHFVQQRGAGKETRPLPADYVVLDSDFDDMPEDGWHVALDVD